MVDKLILMKKYLNVKLDNERGEGEEGKSLKINRKSVVMVTM